MTIKKEIKAIKKEKRGKVDGRIDKNKRRSSRMTQKLRD